ncbi:hypothetical protein LC612_32500 [Nostoc sp. CHAB 5834]|nr:hypothetical protein [Nostoc sp. CHAB 5834]
MYSVFEYSYRDAYNYKVFGHFALDGALTPEQISEIENKLSDGEFFIPFDLHLPGLRDLQPQMSNYPSESDHVWHALETQKIETFERSPDDVPVFRVQDFMSAWERIKTRNHWDVEAAVFRHNI